jgi:hypothetical protein
MYDVDWFRVACHIARGMLVASLVAALIMYTLIADVVS